MTQLGALDADIYGIIEIENDGEAEESAQQYLVNALTNVSKKLRKSNAKNYQFEKNLGFQHIQGFDEMTISN